MPLPGLGLGSGLGIGLGATDGAVTGDSLKEGIGAGSSRTGSTGLPLGGKLLGRVGAKLQAVTPNIKSMLSACKLLKAALPFKLPRLVTFSLTAEQYSSIGFSLSMDLRPFPQGVPVLARMPRWLPWSLILLFALPAPTEAGGLPHGGVGQEGAWVPEPGVSEVAIGSRFAPMQVFGGTPDLGLRVGTWSGGSLGLGYSRAGMLNGNPHELEFSLKQALWSEGRGHPLSVSLSGALNTGAYSLDGELALSRRLGPVTMLGTARLLGNAEGARMPLGGLGMGTEVALGSGLALIGDVFQVANLAGAAPAWGAGVRMRLPATPYAATLFLTNTASSARQGASLGTPDLRLGIGLGMAFGAGLQERMGPVSKGAAVAALQPPTRQLPTPEPQPSPPGAMPAQAEPAKVAAAAPAGTVRLSTLPKPASVSPVEAKSKPPAEAAPVKPAQRVSKKAARPPAKSPVKPPASPLPAAGAVAKTPRAHELWIVMIRDGVPTPGQIRLAKGSSVTWFNRDAVPHAWVADGWETGVIAPGKQITRRFERLGTSRYRCRVHPGEDGSITVR